MGRAIQVRYRNFGLTALLCVVASGLTLLAVGFAQGKGAAAPGAAPAPDGIVRRHVTVRFDHTTEGCRWLPAAQPDGAQMVQCGDRYESELIVFGKDTTTSYRVTVVDGSGQALGQTQLAGGTPAGAASGSQGGAAAQSSSAAAGTRPRLGPSTSSPTVPRPQPPVP